MELPAEFMVIPVLKVIQRPRVEVEARARSSSLLAKNNSTCTTGWNEGTEAYPQWLQMTCGNNRVPQSSSTHGRWRFCVRLHKRLISAFSFEWLLASSSYTKYVRESLEYLRFFLVAGVTVVIAVACEKFLSSGWGFSCFGW